MCFLFLQGNSNKRKSGIFWRSNLQKVTFRVLFFTFGFQFKRNMLKLIPRSDILHKATKYFVTSDGEDFIEVFMQALNKAKGMKEPIEIDSM